MEGNMFKKGLVVGIIFLFIGVSIAPGITATIHLPENTTTTISKSEELKSDLVEITVQICGTEWGKESKVKISIEAYNELKNLFDNLKIKLHNSKTRDERNSILNNAIISLDELGILPEYISIEELQQLVTGVNYNSRFLYLFELLKTRNKQQINENYNCEIVGVATRIYDFRLIDFFLVFTAKIRWLIDFLLFWLPSTWLTIYKFLSFGFLHVRYAYHEYHHPSVGWIWTDGRNGVVDWNGGFYGGMYKISEYAVDDGYSDYFYYIGASFFRGVRIIVNIVSETFYIVGNAGKVHLEPYS